MSTDEQTIHISFRALTFFVIAVIIIAGGVYVLVKNNESPQINIPQAEKPLDPTPTQTETKDTLFLSQDGIDVSIDDITRTETETIVLISMSNHALDLADPSVQTRSSFNDIAPAKYTVLSEFMGGHHVEAELTFPGNLEGKLIIGATEKNSFEFDVL